MCFAFPNLAHASQAHSHPKRSCTRPCLPPPLTPPGRSLLPPSPQEYHLVGLNLLRLLVENRIAEFHTELELIPDQV